MEEIWKDLPEWPSLYEASNLGRFRKKAFGKRPAFIKALQYPVKNQPPTIQITVNGKTYTYLAARLIAETFLGVPYQSKIYYKDGDFNHIDVDNLTTTCMPEYDSHEEWRDVEEYEGIYQVSNLGNLRTLTRIIPHSRLGYSQRQGYIHMYDMDNPNYLSVGLWKNGQCKQYMLHVLVARAFIPNPENKPEVNHKDGKRRHNWVDNLEWVTSKENSQHSIITGLKPNDGKWKPVICNETGRYYPSISAAARDHLVQQQDVRLAAISGRQVHGHTFHLASAEEIQ